MTELETDINVLRIGLRDIEKVYLVTIEIVRFNKSVCYIQILLILC